MSKKETCHRLEIQQTFNTETGLVAYVVTLDDFDKVIATMDEQAKRLNAEIDKLSLHRDKLITAGDALDAYLKRQDGTTNGMLDCRVEWLKAKEVQS